MRFLLNFILQWQDTCINSFSNPLWILVMVERTIQDTCKITLLFWPWEARAQIYTLHVGVLNLVPGTSRSPVKQVWHIKTVRCGPKTEKKLVFVHLEEFCWYFIIIMFQCYFFLTISLDILTKLFMIGFKSHSFITPVSPLVSANFYNFSCVLYSCTILMNLWCIFTNVETFAKWTCVIFI